MNDHKIIFVYLENWQTNTRHCEALTGYVGFLHTKLLGVTILRMVALLRTIRGLRRRATRKSRPGASGFLFHSSALLLPEHPSSQKEENALQHLSLSTIARTTSPPTTARNFSRCLSHDGHTASVCSVSSDASSPPTQSLLICSGFVCYGDPRIDDIDENENLIEYSYRYAVDESKHQGPVMDRWEQRIGEYVKGAYSVVDPDGRVRTVDYEVDGKKGYHAVIRMNEPGPELLSLQQLTKSFELFPEASLPTPPETPTMPSRNLSPPDSSGKAWNYHSNTPYVNQIGLKQDHKEAATTRVTKTATAVRDLENLPLSPANYNVPQTTNLIYYSTPAASIFHQTFKSLDSGNSLPRAIKREAFFPILIAEDDEFGLQKRPRNSKLVRRYKSFADVLS